MYMYNKSKLVCGVGINDYKDSIYTNFNNKRSHIKSYQHWRALLSRCYKSYPSLSNLNYKDCSVCDEWLLFSNFKKWFDEHYIESYHLDKDILVKGNRIYSPSTCCFVPDSINTLIIKRKKGRLPQGVYKPKHTKLYTARVRHGGNKENLGYYNSPFEAFEVYKKSKIEYIKHVAIQYYKDNKISKNIYDALMAYDIDIND